MLTLFSCYKTLIRTELDFNKIWIRFGLEHHAEGCCIHCGEIAGSLENEL